jgi:hypothetical protein
MFPNLISKVRGGVRFVAYGCDVIAISTRGHFAKIANKMRKSP